MRATRTGRLRRLLSVGTVAGAVLVGSIAWAGMAHASTVAGPITRAEILDRAKYWVDQHVTYTQTATAPDPQGKAYRRDCSGLVSMAWHLSSSLLTQTQNGSLGFNDFTGKTWLNSLNDLLPGDAILRSGHMELFAFWKNNSDHTQGAYVYSFNTDGETVQNPYGPSNYGNVGFDSWSDLNTYQGIRYDNVVDGVANKAASPSDVNGDGRGDLLGVKADGSLWYYSNNGGSAPFGNGSQIGNGFTVFNQVVASDVSGDGSADLLGLKPDGTLWYYPNNSATNAGHAPYTTGVQVGAGFDVFNQITSADLNGDHRADLIGLKPDGSLWSYANNGGSAPFGNGSQIGSGFNIFSTVLAADVSGDGAADLLGLKPDGTLWYYPNNSATNAGHAPFTTGYQVGAGFNVFSRLTAMDIDGDGAADLVGVKPDGSLLYYPNVHGTAPYGNGVPIGAGFNVFGQLF